MRMIDAQPGCSGDYRSNYDFDGFPDNFSSTHFEQPSVKLVESRINYQLKVSCQRIHELQYRLANGLREYPHHTPARASELHLVGENRACLFYNSKRLTRPFSIYERHPSASAPALLIYFDHNPLE